MLAFVECNADFSSKSSPVRNRWLAIALGGQHDYRTAARRFDGTLALSSPGTVSVVVALTVDHAS
jgi:hypothetical protein